MKEVMMIVCKDFEQDAKNLIEQIEETGTKVHAIVLETEDFEVYIKSCSCDKTKILEMGNGNRRI